MKLYSNCAKYLNKEIDIEEIDGGTSEVAVDCDEDYLIGMAYVAQCHTFSRYVNLEKYSTTKEREKMVDLLLQVLDL
mgnify:CR=1 FL=1